MNLYFYDGKKLTGQESEKMALNCVKSYVKEFGEGEELDIEYRNSLGEKELQRSKKWDITKSEHGKPFLPKVNLDYNVSHSGLLWVCVVSKQQIGIDIQEVREAKYEDIAKRFFTPDEFHYVELWGQEGFFDIWVRKEAYVKFLGQGFAGEGFSNFSVLDEKGDLKDTIGEGEKSSVVIIPDMGFDIKCAICTKKEESLELRAIG